MPWDRGSILDRIREKLEHKNTPPEITSLHLDYDEKVLLALEAKYADRYPNAYYVGVGGSGIVVRLSVGESDGQARSEADSEGITPVRPEQCIKFPLAMLERSAAFSPAEVLRNEAKMLAKLHHQYVMPVEEFDSVSIESAPGEIVEVPYYAMPFIASIDLAQYVKRPEATAQNLLRIIQQSALAMQHIHQAGLVHLDIKPGNIFVQRYGEPNPTALLSDFGFCKSVRKGSETETTVMGTNNYIHPELLSLMEHPTDSESNRIRDRVKRGKLESRFDLYSFAVTIAQALVGFLSSERPSGGPTTMPTCLLRGLQLVTLRCSDGYPHRVREVKGLDLVLPERLFLREHGVALKYGDTDLLIENLAALSADPQGHPMEDEVCDVCDSRICLPPRSFAPFTKRVEATVDSVFVRRLANMSQLALCYHVYPGATHNRKEHVIGVFQACCRLLRRLLLDSERPLCRMLLTRKHQRVLLLSALLHDSSHFPLMHDMEHALPKLRQQHYMCGIVEGTWGNAATQVELGAILSAWQVTRAELLAVVGDASDRRETTEAKGCEGWRALWRRPEYELARSFTDGAFDADKLDYLQRDSLHVGTGYGFGVDTQRLEHTATAALWSEYDRHSRPVLHCGIAATEKGQPAAEGVIAARHNMHVGVYAHRTVRAARAMLNFVAWSWLGSEKYDKLGSSKATDILFLVSSGLGSPSEELLAEVRETVRFEPGPRDNLPYQEAAIVRWMAQESGVKAAKDVAEALIERRLYKQVYALTENDVRTFLDEAFPARGTRHLRSNSRVAFGARVWLELTEYLGRQVAKHFKKPDTATTPVVVGDNKSSPPPMLVDVTIPKAMDTQKELMVLSDACGREVHWRRLEQLREVGVRGCEFATDVTPSPVYDIYRRIGENEAVERVVVRLVARPDLAPALRTHLPRAEGIRWLEMFKPSKP